MPSLRYQPGAPAVFGGEQHADRAADDAHAKELLCEQRFEHMIQDSAVHDVVRLRLNTLVVPLISNL